MKTRWAASFLALFAVTLTCASISSAQGEAAKKAAGARPGGALRLFSEPKLLRAGAEEMGSNCLYPSPALIDLDGDGVREMVIGGLRGYLWVSRRTKKGWGPEVKLKAADGRDLKFSNW